jgi:hypothetical protein
MRFKGYLRDCSYIVYSFFKNPRIDWDPSNHLCIQGQENHVNALLRSEVMLHWLHSRIHTSRQKPRIVVVESVLKSSRPEFSLYQSIYPFWLRYGLVNSLSDAAKMKKSLSSYLISEFGQDISHLPLGNLPRNLLSSIVDFYAQTMHGLCLVAPSDTPLPNFSLNTNMIVTLSGTMNENRLSNGLHARTEVSTISFSHFVESMIARDVMCLPNDNANYRQLAGNGGALWDDDDDEEEDYDEVRESQPNKFSQYGHSHREIKKVISFANSTNDYVQCRGTLLLVSFSLIARIATQRTTPIGRLCVVQVKKPCVSADFALLLKLFDDSEERHLPESLETTQDNYLAVNLREDAAPSNIYLCQAENVEDEAISVPCCSLIFLAHLHRYI